MTNDLADQLVADRSPATRAVPPEKLRGSSASEGAEARTVQWLHRGVTLSAVMALVVGTRGFWTGHALTRPGLAFALTCVYLFMLVAAILVLCSSSSRTLVRLDVAVLGTAIGIKIIGAWPSLIGEKAIVVDEGILMDRATRALAAASNPYLRTWKDIEPDVPTQLMNGHPVHDFAYPPFGIEMGAVVQRLLPSIPGVVVVAWFALVVAAVIIFLAAPVPLRSLATLGVLGLGTLTRYAENAYPSLIALPFLCVAVWGWSSIGRGGRFGRSSVIRALALGLACSTHQLGWFLTLFLVVGVAVLRRGELSLRATAAVLTRYVGIALGVFVVTSAPFIIASPKAWLTSIFEPMLQHAVPHGQGIMGLTQYVIGGSGALDFYSHASKLLLVAMLIAFALHLRILGPAAVVLPWLVFMVSTRSQDGYWVLTMPLWLVALFTTSRDDFAGAYRFRLPERLSGLVPAGRIRVVGILATVALFLPVAACVAVAVATPQPLDMRLTTPIVPKQTVSALTVHVTNRSAEPVTPNFAVATGVTIAEYWNVQAGPATLPSHGSATYILTPPDKPWKVVADKPAFLRAVSDHPQTLSSIRVL